ncbi:MAG TPA: isopentenyl-diphosphate Delta-isomerase [bacterium]|nr:isopentenyl-diphosphate Delta-isomerase [bacterium]
MDENINLVNESGVRIGSIEKLAAHVEGKLHEAFSIFVFNNDHDLLLQRRAFDKYHSGGLWTNTCCSHAHVGEKIGNAVHRRLVEEMGFDCELTMNFNFLYKTNQLTNNLIEHEFDYVFSGLVTEKIDITPNPAEVCDFKWISIDNLLNDVSLNPTAYTEWLKIILKSSKFSQMLLSE